MTEIKLEQERDNWIEAARLHLKNEIFYRNIIEQIGNTFGVAARTSDDGSIQDHVLALKVPELVDQMHKALADFHDYYDPKGGVSQVPLGPFDRSRSLLKPVIETKNSARYWVFMIEGTDDDPGEETFGALESDNLKDAQAEIKRFFKTHPKVELCCALILKKESATNAMDIYKEAMEENKLGQMTKDKIKKKSKRLSKILRHNPASIGIELDEGGWASVKELLQKLNMSIDELRDIVKNNDKKRFVFNDKLTKIRASQGHSIPVKLDLKSCEPPDVLYHGTSIKFVDNIFSNGLLKMNRNHVHLSVDKKTAIVVGSRKGMPVTLKIDARKMYSQGYAFYISDNGVWLIDNVPPEFIDLY